MPVKERLPKNTIKEVLPLPPRKPESRGKPLIIKDLVDFQIPDISIMSFRPDSIHSGKSEVTCLTKCNPCRTEAGYPAATCDTCLPPHGNCSRDPDDEPDAAKYNRFRK